MTKYNWDSIPKQYNWVGYNRHGIIRAFRGRPRAMDGFWADCNEEFTEWVGELPTVMLWEDWKDSLEERPQPPKRYQIDKGDGLLRIIDTLTNQPLSGYEIVDLLNERKAREQ